MIRKEEWMKIIDDYRIKHCKEDGSQKVESLNKDEMIGMRRIMKRVTNDEIVIQVSDKCHKLCVSTKEEYWKQGMVHVRGADKVNEG